ncbi:methyltransferase domain-containing protein [Acetobacteraceae bacterium]|nr:methyltransferase domain-containing protein [Candidatus Parcubacteria bacterium]
MAQTLYFKPDTVKIPGIFKTLLSRLAFPLLVLLSREQSLRLGLTPIDDERVIQALKHARGRLLDIGCGANNLVRSYGNGTGADVVAWEGSDVVIEDAGKLPFEDGSYDTVSFLACLNHIPNREEALTEAFRVLRPEGQVLVTMITPRIGQFTHWLRRPHDPDEHERHIDHDDELLGMSPNEIRSLLAEAGFKNIRRTRFVYGLNNLFTANK